MAEGENPIDEELRQARERAEEKRLRREALAELATEEQEEENVEVIQQKKQKLVMDFQHKTQHPERMTMEVLKDMVKKDPNTLSQAARNWLKESE
ncbi:MAG: hypothetical protein QGG55_01935 [Verrucomicrobiota bacterium]|jgi:hypothetical protein|nr:hypothetical protein [Verrucomicrobiota bacterium]|tara:strand:+ start:326 stop:610 length:285 start_codon:yes stop_codon:yes gene_type:complete